MKQYSQYERQESLDVLNYQIRACEKCRLHTTRIHALTGEGDLNARIMFVALSPGAKENIQNRMFIGPSGKIFDKLLYEAGIDRKLPEGFSMSPHSHITTEQHFVLKGEYQSGDENFIEGSYQVFSQGEEHGPFKSKTGALILVIWDSLK